MFSPVNEYKPVSSKCKNAFSVVFSGSIGRVGCPLWNVSGSIIASVKVSSAKILNLKVLPKAFPLVCDCTAVVEHFN